MTAQPEPGCCLEHRCRRSQPIRVFRSELTGTWYAVTQWADRGEGRIESVQKHRVHTGDAQQLEMLFDAWEAREEGRRQIVDVPLPAGEEPITLTVDRTSGTPPSPWEMRRKMDEAEAPAAECRWCGQALHFRGGLFRGPDEKSICPQFGSGNPIATHEPRALPT